MTCRQFALLSAFAVPALVQSVQAQIPQMIAYQGRVAAGGINFHGTGQFKFAIVNGAYTGLPGETAILWSNDGSLASTAANGVPTAAVNLTCDRGLYSVLLGNTAAGMVAVPPSAFAMADVRLRVWFNDGTRGWQLLTPDQRLVSVGYAMMAASAQTVPDGSINSLKLANGAVTAGKLADNSVVSSNLVDSSITAAKLNFGAVSSDKIQDNSITAADIFDGTVNTADLADGSVTSAKILDGTIGTADLGNSAVTGAKIAAGTVATGNIADAAITSAKILAAAVGTAQIADAAVTNAKLSAGAVGTQQIQTGAVRSQEILDNSIGSGDILDGTISTVDLAASAVTAAKIATDTITSQEIGAGAVGTSELADLGVGTADLANSAVTATKLAANAVTTSALAAFSVSTAKLQSASVTYDKLALDCVTEGEIVDGSVHTPELANAAVTVDKMANAIAGVVTIPATNIPNAGGSTSGQLLIPWSTELTDTASFHSPATPDKMTIPRTGLYIITVDTYFGSATFYNNQISLRRNANSNPNGGENLSAASVLESPRINVSTVVPLTAGDTLEVWAFSERTIGTTYPVNSVQGRWSVAYLGNLP